MNKEIIETAIKMCKRAYAPFSNYKVGSAVEVRSGKIIGGCNIESSSYGLTCCAERVAIFRAIAEGYNQFKSIAVATKMLVCPVAHADKLFGSFAVKYRSTSVA